MVNLGKSNKSEFYVVVLLLCASLISPIGCEEEAVDEDVSEENAMCELECSVDYVADISCLADIVTCQIDCLETDDLDCAIACDTCTQELDADFDACAGECPCLAAMNTYVDECSDDTECSNACIEDYDYCTAEFWIYPCYHGCSTTRSSCTLECETNSDTATAYMECYGTCMDSFNGCVNGCVSEV